MQGLPNYVDILREKLVEKSKITPRFSIRSFSRSVGVSHALLSQVLNHKKNLSKNSAIKVANQLEFKSKEKELFLALVELAQKNINDEHKAFILDNLVENEEMQNSTDISQDVFQIISNWHFYALLSLADIEHIPYNSETLAPMIGISRLECTQCIHKLVQLNLLEKISDSKYKQTNHAIKTNSDRSNLFMKKYHLQMLKMAEKALYEQSIEQRRLTNLTVAVDKDILPEVLDKIRSFHFSLSKFIDENSKNKNRVYQFGTYFYDLVPDLKIGVNNETTH